jgi:hypothetical protein
MIRSIAVAGLICGVLDGLSAVALFGWLGADAGTTLSGIARGALGPAALTGGGAAVTLGVVAHFTVAFGAAGA